MAEAKYYDRIKELERDEAGKPADRRTVDDTEFDFSKLKSKSLFARIIARLFQQRWLYAFLRTCFPVLKLNGIYFVTRYEDVEYIRKNDARFEAPYGREMDALTGGAGFLLGMGRGADYDRQFKCIMHGVAGQPAAFQPGDLDKFVLPKASAAADQLIQAAAGEFDVIEDYLNRIAVETCCHHYGLEPEDPNAFARWLMSLSALLFADYNGAEEVRNLAMAGAKRIHPVTNTAVKQARFCLESPSAAAQQHGQAYCDWITDTVIGRLVAQQLADPDEGPSDEDIRGMIMGLAVGFVPTGAGGGGGILEVLLSRPAVMRRAEDAARAGEDGVLERILLEAMRFKPPILPGLPRYVTSSAKNDAAASRNRRVDKIPVGATILAASFSAMFDGRKFGGGIKRFDESRELTNDDLSFGGADFLHYCIGEQIFRVMITQAFKRLLVCEDLKPASGQAGKMERTGPFPVHMQMTFTPETGLRRHSMLTICVPLEHPDDAAKLNRWLDKLGNPANERVSQALMAQPHIHFAHMTAIADTVRSIPANLLIEINADGDAETAITAFVDGLWDHDLFQKIMMTALGLNTADPDKVKARLLSHNFQLKITPWPDPKNKTMGLNFNGLPEQSVPQIDAEKRLAQDARGHLDTLLQRRGGQDPSARDAVMFIRRQLKHGGDQRESARLVRPVQKTPTVSRRTTLPLSETLGLYARDRGFLITVFGSIGVFWLCYFVFLNGGIPHDFTWSDLGHLAINAVHIGLAFILFYAAHGLRQLAFGSGSKASRIGWALATLLVYLIVAPIGIWGAGSIDMTPQPDYLSRLYTLAALLWAAALSIVFGFLLWISVVLGFGWLFLRLLKASEEGIPPEDTDLDQKKYEEIMTRENQPDHAQNHIVFVTPLKDNPSWLRRVTMFIGFYFIKTLVLYRFRYGFVLDLGTIHFARWFLLPKSHTMVFYSNYDGSGESYFEDFVTKARWGQTGVWSNGKGFPETENLLFKGAKDATRFKRWIRHHQQVSRFWFARFNELSTRDIRRNAVICEGLAKARTDNEYRALIELMTSRPRTDDMLESREIQSLLLRGMGNLKAARMVALNFPPEGKTGNAALAAWLADLSGMSTAPTHAGATFDGRVDKDEAQAINVAISPRGLRRLRLHQLHHVHKDLASDSFSSLPGAFRSGMTSAGRKQILGDTNHEDWTWGSDGEPDAVLMIYAKGEEGLRQFVTDEITALQAAGFSIVTEIETKPIKEKPMREPFGFVDGVSQPVIRGTSGSIAAHNRMHVVEPGEFVLGYRDNTEYFPTSPLVNAHAPGAAHLPSIPDKPASDYPAFGTEPHTAPRDLGKNGSFLVVRQLEQDPARFKAHLKAQADTAREEYGFDYIDEDWLAAKIMGRWKNGASIVRSPRKDIPSPSISLSVDDNDFQFGAEDPQGLNCPLGAHIRRANPRDSQDPANSDRQIALSNRHRLLRRARAYEDPQSGKEGLLFMCLNANLERQFEFVQQTWLNSTRFHGVQEEYDSIAGNASQATNRLTIPTAAGPIQVKGLQSFVTVKGGGYFFMPSRSALRFFSEFVASQAE
ncbi:MAG: Dyp-type peroxidase [Hyphomonas sp.]|nr:Dyp-type peroxidase [Hyphomonas sp.]